MPVYSPLVLFKLTVPLPLRVSEFSRNNSVTVARGAHGHGSGIGDVARRTQNGVVVNGHRVAAVAEGQRARVAGLIVGKSYCCRAAPMVTALVAVGTPALQLPAVVHWPSPAVPVQVSPVSGGGAFCVAFFAAAAMLATGCALSSVGCDGLLFDPAACATARALRLKRTARRHRTLIRRVTGRERWAHGRLHIKDSVGTSANVDLQLLVPETRNVAQ